MNENWDATLHRQVRILLILDAAEKASLSPIQVLPFHALAYLANVLAPVWDMQALDGKILKRKGGPFYPDLQRDLDGMVGRGMVRVQNVHHVKAPDGRWRVEGHFYLNHELSLPALTFLHERQNEWRVASFIQELAYAFSALSDTDLGRALVEDATYSDPNYSEENVLDFEEWNWRNPSANAARFFDQFMPRGTKATVGEQLHLYIRHLHRRIHDA